MLESTTSRICNCFKTTMAAHQEANIDVASLNYITPGEFISFKERQIAELKAFLDGTYTSFLLPI